MDDLVQWLGEQLDEDDRTARAASAGWYNYSPSEQIAFVPPEDSAHIATHSPARVLREIDAKRQIVALHGLVHRDISWLEDGEEEPAEIAVCSSCVPRHAAYSHRHDVPAGPCATVRLLALPYADRPGYREEWRP